MMNDESEKQRARRCALRFLQFIIHHSSFTISSVEYQL